MQTTKILLLVPDGMNILTAALVCKDACKITTKDTLNMYMYIIMYILQSLANTHLGVPGLRYTFLPGHHAQFILEAKY